MPVTTTISAAKQLAQLRRAIANQDKALLQVLKKRQVLQTKIAKLKAKQQVPVVQQQHWQAAQIKRLKTAAQLQLDLQFIEQLFQLIHRQSIKKQAAVIAELNS